MLARASAVFACGTALCAGAAAAEPTPLIFLTHHRLTLGSGARLAYTAEAAETILRDPEGRPSASLFAFSYLKDGGDPTRPVTFVFNGGPGSSSLWLHMGVLGPRRVVLNRDPNPRVTPPFTVENNPLSPLDLTDLVFVDPVGTGFSHAVAPTPATAFYGVDEDADGMARFMEAWLSAHGRWNAPKFVVGESYGSVRAAVLPRALMGGPTSTGVMRGITLNGVVLLGTILNARDGDDDPPELAAATALPGMADAAWYHGRVPRRGLDLDAFDAEARRFALERYLPAVREVRAGTLDAGRLHAVADETARLTGVPAQEWVEHGLQFDAAAFTRRLLADQGLQIGLYDSRYTLPLTGAGVDPVADDPAMAQYVPAFVGGFHQMLHDDLKVDLRRPYRAIVWRGLLDHWNWSRAGVPKGQDFAVDLVAAMRRDPKLRVLVASGCFDLATHPLAAEHLLQRAGAPADRISFRNYPSGHMLYVGATAPAFVDDLRTLIHEAR